MFDIYNDDFSCSEKQFNGSYVLSKVGMLETFEGLVYLSKLFEVQHH